MPTTQVFSYGAIRKNLLKDESGDFMGLFRDAIHGIASGVESATNSVEDAAGAVSKFSSEAWDHTGGAAITAVHYAWDSTTNTVSDAYQSTVDGVEDAAGAVSKFSIEAWDHTGGAAITTVHSAWDSTTSAVDYAYHSTTDAVSGAWDSTTQSIASVANDAWEFIY